MGCLNSKPLPPVRADPWGNRTESLLDKYIRRYNLDVQHCLGYKFTTPERFDDWVDSQLKARRGLQALLIDHDDAANYIQGGMTQKEWDVLFQCIRDNPGLIVIQLSGHVMNEPLCIQLAEVVRGCPELQVLDLFGNQIEDRGALLLADTCSQLPKMHRLNLGNNALTVACRDSIGETINNRKESRFRVLFM